MVQQKIENHELQPFISNSKPVTVEILIFSFFYILYKYLLNLKKSHVDKRRNIHSYFLLFFISFLR
jgi:hypothetical protein